MNRILISMLGRGLLGFSALGMATLGFLWYSPTGATRRESRRASGAAGAGEL